jgi:hypothetical protein
MFYFLVILEPNAQPFDIGDPDIKRKVVLFSGSPPEFILACECGDDLKVRST